MYKKLKAAVPVKCFRASITEGYHGSKATAVVAKACQKSTCMRRTMQRPVPCPTNQMIFFDLSSRMHTTTPATITRKHIQNAQHIHVRWRRFFRWLSSHESLFDGSAVTDVQNLKREGGRPERPNVSWEELPCLAKAREGLRGDLAALAWLVEVGVLVRRRGSVGVVGVVGCEGASGASGPMATGEGG